jgi:hypothetical protein
MVTRAVSKTANPGSNPGSPVVRAVANRRFADDDLAPVMGGLGR